MFTCWLIHATWEEVWFLICNFADHYSSWGGCHHRYISCMERKIRGRTGTRESQVSSLIVSYYSFQMCWVFENNYLQNLLTIMVFRLMPESVLLAPKEKKLTGRQWFQSGRATAVTFHLWWYAYHLNQLITQNSNVNVTLIPNSFYLFFSERCSSSQRRFWWKWWRRNRFWWWFRRLV